MFCPNCGLQSQLNTPECPKCHYPLGARISHEAQQPVDSQVQASRNAQPALVEAARTSEIPPAQRNGLATAEEPRRDDAGSPPANAASQGSTVRGHLVRFIIGMIVLIGVTLACTGLRSNSLYQSSLRSPSALWDTGSEGKGAACLFEADGYNLHGLANCGAQLSPQSDFYLSIDVRDVRVNATEKSDDYSHTFGLILRANLVGSGSRVSLRGYFFVINPFHGWAFLKIAGSHEWILASGTNDALRPGFNVTNTLAVSALGSRFDLFANGFELAQVDDTAFSSGLLRLLNTSTTSSDVVFTNISITRTA